MRHFLYRSSAAHFAARGIFGTSMQRREHCDTRYAASRGAAK
jgi:hypothetical protein